MYIVKVIESRRWKNSKTGQTASIYGAVPYYSEKDKADWEIETIGYTWANSDGTIGLGRVPVKTEQEAIDVMNRINNR